MVVTFVLRSEFPGKVFDEFRDAMLEEQDNFDPNFADPILLRAHFTVGSYRKVFENDFPEIDSRRSMIRNSQMFGQEHLSSCPCMGAGCTRDRQERRCSAPALPKCSSQWRAVCFA